MSVSFHLFKAKEKAERKSDIDWTICFIRVVESNMKTINFEGLERNKRSKIQIMVPQPSS